MAYVPPKFKDADGTFGVPEFMASLALIPS